MSSPKGININVGSGSFKLGTLSQGDNNQLNTEVKQTTQAAPASWDGLIKELEEAALNANIAHSEVEDLKARVEKLYAEKEQPDFIERSGDTLELIYKAYGWAAPALRALFAI